MNRSSLALLASIAALTFACGSAETEDVDGSESATVIGTAPVDSQSPRCRNDELTVFTCRIVRANGSTKVASVCASRDIDRIGGTMKYRYGTPEKADIELPAEGGDFRRFVRWENFDGGPKRLSFDNRGTVYSVTTDPAGGATVAVYQNHVQIQGAGGECQPGSYEELDPELMSRAGLASEEVD